jgi:hypothetical protein
MPQRPTLRRWHLLKAVLGFLGVLALVSAVGGLGKLAPHSQHADTPVEAPESALGKGSIEAGDDLNDFDDFAYHLRVVFDGSALLSREVERGVSLGGRALSRLEDNRSDKPPRG